MWGASIGVRHTGCPISDTSSEFPDVSIQNVSRIDVRGSRSRRLLYLSGKVREIKAFAEAFRERAVVTSFQRVSDSFDSRVYYTAEIAYSEENPSIMSLVDDNGVFNHGPISVQRGTEHWVVYGRPRSRVERLVTGIERYDNPVRINRLAELNGSNDLLQDLEGNSFVCQLTDRQRTTFETALRMEYYEGDAETTIADIGEELGVHETTAWEHLKKAENKILTEVGTRVFSSSSGTDR